MKRLRRIVGCALALLFPFAQAGSFALIGDMPYSEHEVGMMRTILEEIGADDSIAFVIHDGDIKSGKISIPESDFGYADREETWVDHMTMEEFETFLDDVGNRNGIYDVEVTVVARDEQNPQFQTVLATGVK